MNARMPVVFLSHGSPMVALEEGEAYARDVRASAQSLPRPRAILVVSAHWEAPGLPRISASLVPELIYDFGGFPDELYRLGYPCLGSPELASRILDLLQGASLDAVLDGRRGLDHGAWIPLRLAYPDASIPVVQVALPVPRSPELVFRMGQALAPLREEGVLLLGSGGLVHNLRRLHWGEQNAPVDGWAAQFEAWLAERLEHLNIPTLLEYRRLAPQAALAAPTTEHFDPLFFSLGACQPDDRVRWIHRGVQYGNLSMGSLLFQAE